MLSDGGQTYTWNAAGRLITVTGDVVAGYRYNGDGNRVSSEVDGELTRYLVDPFSPIDRVPQVLVEKTAGERTRYLYGLDLLGQIQGGTPAYLGYDALSVRLHVNNSGEIESTYRYGPFGETVGEGASGYGFSGEKFDAEPGLLYLRARYYAPAVGRFVSRDRWGGNNLSPQSLNRYSYVQNRPLKYIDPTGHTGTDPVTYEYMDEPLFRSRADWIVDYLAQTYDINIVSYGHSRNPRCREPNCLDKDPSWKIRLWSEAWDLENLEVILTVVKAFEAEAGSAQATRQALGGISIWHNGPNICRFFWEEGRAYTYPSGNICVMYDAFHQTGARARLGPYITIAHELCGHRWAIVPGTDLDRQLYKALQYERPPTKYATENHWERWAESVAMYLYPEYRDILIREMKSDYKAFIKEMSVFPLGLPGLRPGYRDFIADQFAELRAGFPAPPEPSGGPPYLPIILP